MENKRIIQIMGGIIVVLALVILYFFVVKPQFDKSALDNQVSGYNIAINSILTQLKEQGYVTMTIGNQTLYLVPYNPNAQNSTA